MKHTQLLQITICLLLASCTKTTTENSNGIVSPTPEVSTFATTDKFLKTANTSVSMGVAVKDINYNTWTANYQPTVNAHFSRVTSENDMKFGAIRPTESQFVYNDDFINTAKTNGITVHGHTLCWYNSLPDWLYTKENATPASQRRAVFQQILKTHITTVIQHYATIRFADNSRVVKSWDVVNEAFDDDGTRRNTSASIWERTIGSDYIDSAFRWARRAANAVGNTSLKLLYNDYGQEYSSTKSAAIAGMLNNLKNAATEGGLPIIDGVGLQLHTSTHTTIFKPTGGSTGGAYSIEEGIAKMASTGLVVHISELDVAYTNVYGNNIPESEKTAMQNSIYYNTPLLYRKNVTDTKRFGITLWSLTDGTSFQSSQHPCVFDDTYTRKDLFYSFYGGLSVAY